MKSWLVLAAAIAAATVGCAGFPSEQKPAKLTEAAPLDGLEADGGGAWPAHDWWKRYQDPTLDQLIALGGADSPSLAAAHARFDSARQSVRIAAAESGAHIEANAAAERQRLSENGLFPPNYWDSPGTTSSTSVFKPPTPLTGGVSSAPPWKRQWTRRTPQKLSAALRI